MGVLADVKLGHVETISSIVCIMLDRLVYHVCVYVQCLLIKYRVGIIS